MKKLIAVLALTFPLLANAQNWSVIVKTDSEQVLVDLDSVDLKEYTLIDNSKSWMISADMVIPETKELMMVAIDAQECVLKNSGSIVFYMPQTDKAYERYWTTTGNRVYDKQGQFLCYIAQQLANKHKQTNKAKKIPV